MADTFVVDNAVKMYRLSGQFTTTVLASIPVRPTFDPIAAVNGMSWDDTDTFMTMSNWPNAVRKLMKISGAFTSTVKSSLSVAAIDDEPEGISWSGGSTLWVGNQANKLYEQAGAITSTMTTSLPIASLTVDPVDLSYDGANTCVISNGGNKIYWLSGKFTTTVLSSYSFPVSFSERQGCGCTGSDTMVAAAEGATKQGAMYIFSGKVTSTIKSSLPCAAIFGSTNTPYAIETSDTTARLAGGGGGTGSVVWYNQEHTGNTWRGQSMFLKQSTARTVKIGPFVNSSGTIQAGLTISQADIRLSKNGGNMAQSNNAAGATYDESGMYDIPLDATDTDTAGELDVTIDKTPTALPITVRFYVQATEAFNVNRNSTVFDLARSSHVVEGSFGEAIRSPHYVDDDLAFDVNGMPTSRSRYDYDTAAHATAHAKTLVGGNYYKRTMAGLSWDADENPATAAKFTGALVS